MSSQNHTGNLTALAAQNAADIANLTATVNQNTTSLAALKTKTVGGNFSFIKKKFGSGYSSSVS